MGTPTILIARTDANSAKLMTSDIDPYDNAINRQNRVRRYIQSLEDK